MADNVIEEFLVGLGFQFEGEEGERFKKQTQQITSVINVLSAAAAAATTALFVLSKQQGQNAYNMATTAKVMDTNAQALGKWRYAAERAGTSGDAVVSMLQGLKNMSQEAMRTGNGPFRAFEELGVDFQGIADGSVDVAKALEDIITTAQSLDRATAQSGLRELSIDPVLLDTPIERLREFMIEYEQFGKMTDQLAQKGGELDVAMAGAALRWEGIQNMMAERLIPTYVKFFEVLSDGLEWVQEDGFPILDEFVEKMGGWDVILGGLAIVAIPAVVGALGTLAKVLGLVAGGFGAATAAGRLLATGALAGVAGGAGYYAGKMIRDHLPQNAVDEMDDFTLKALAALGVESAQRQVEANQRARDEAQQFIDMMDYQTAHPEEGIDKPDWRQNQAPEPSTRTGQRIAQAASRNQLLDAIIGVESGGRTGLTSSKGAMGLAQLMPDTAKEMAAELGVQYDQDKLLNDGAYNRMLGEAYLAKMLKRYGGDQTLATAAYNAGPGSVDNWLSKNGDPRTGGISYSDWIQEIPFKETRDYTYGIMGQMNTPNAQPEQQGPAMASTQTPAQAPRTITNNFHGLKLSEIEELMRNAEQEQSTLFSDEARDSMVR